MDIALRDRFIELWAKYFDGADLPICFYYSDDGAGRQDPPPTRDHVCLIGQLARVRRGEDLCVDRDSLGCGGARRYLGFTQEVMPNFEHFLSCGIPGMLKGERYKMSPELVRESMKRMPFFEAPAEYVVFKRWDKLTPAD